MKNYFIANGAILDTGMSVEEIRTSVQSNLDESTSGLAQFHLQELSESSVKMVFIRDFLIDPGKPIIFDCDMNLILNIGIEAFLAPRSRWLSFALSPELRREKLLYRYDCFYPFL